MLNPGITPDLGLGGDPFKSTIRDQASWWGDSMQADRAALQYRLEYFEPMSPRLTRGRGYLKHVGNEFRGAGSWPVSSGRVYGQLGISHKDQEAMVDDLGNQYSLYGKGTQGDALIRLQDLPKGFSFQASVPLGASSEYMRSIPLGIGVRYALEDRVIVQASQVRRLYNHAVNLAVEDDALDSSLNLNRLTTTIDARMYLGSSSWLAYSWRTNDFEEIDQLTDAYRYEIIPTGRSSTSEIQLVLGREGDFAFLLGGFWLDFDIGGSAYWGGQRFAKINYFRGDHRAGILGFEKFAGEQTRWLFDLTVSELRGRTWGKVESWPFSDSIGDLLGGRLTFRGGFEANWTRLHAALDRSIGQGRLKVGLAWYNIFPEARIQNWKSGFGFPIGSKENYVLETDHLQLGALSLGGVIPLGGFFIDLEVYQIVYGNAHNNTQQGGDGEGEPGEPVELPGGWFGGTYARAGVRYNF